MARKQQSVAAETLDEIQGSADRFAEWIHENMTLVFGGIATLLVVSGVGAWVSSAGDASELEASTELHEAKSRFLKAMGTSFGALEIPELANPAAAEQIRADYVAELEGISEAYAGTTAEFLAQLQVGYLDHRDGKLEEALATYDALARAGGQPEALLGLAIQRAGQVLEDLGRWDEAAARHEEAAALENFPLRYWALADAARALVEAGELELALAHYARIEDEAPEVRLPDAQRAAARELKALQGGA